ncbi:hypothetical protein [Clostridium sp.]|uniref:hypothetical protein n=1 Tax=Clostridium sp. TaxID=1506 RepID=UPI001A54E5A5|nr:hypothetical protein [Clostridium sp.]MBK5239791.1 hypothetical protein [Clostridium sp.]
MLLICKESVKTDSDILFTKDKEYEFIAVDNRWTRITMKDYNFVGYFKKDDEGFKRWSSQEFKDEYFK